MACCADGAKRSEFRISEISIILYLSENSFLHPHLTYTIWNVLLHMVYVRIQLAGSFALASNPAREKFHTSLNPSTPSRGSRAYLRDWRARMRGGVRAYRCTRRSAAASGRAGGSRGASPQCRGDSDSSR